MIKFGQISIIIFTIIFGLGLLMMGMRTVTNAGIAFVWGEQETLIAEGTVNADNLEEVVASEIVAKSENPEIASLDVETEEPSLKERAASKVAEIREEIVAKKERDKIENVDAKSENVQVATAKTKESKSAVASNRNGAEKYKVIAGCFSVQEYSDRRVGLLAELGYPAQAKQLRSRYEDLNDLNSVIVNRYVTYSTALGDIENLRDNHSIDSYLIKKGDRRLDGLTAYIVMDISNPAAPKETSQVQWVLE